MTAYEKFNEIVDNLLEFGIDLEQAESEALRLFSEEEKEEIIRVNEEEKRLYEKMRESWVSLAHLVVPEDIPW